MVLAVDGVQTAEVAAAVLARVIDAGAEHSRGRLRGGGRAQRPQAQAAETRQPTPRQHAGRCGDGDWRGRTAWVAWQPTLARAVHRHQGAVSSH